MLQAFLIFNNPILVIPTFINNVVFLAKILCWLFDWIKRLDGIDVVINLLVGVVAGAISSIIVTELYSKKIARREARVYLNRLYLNVNELAYQIESMDIELSMAAGSHHDYDLSYERIRSTFGARPYFEKSYLILSTVRIYYPRYKVLSETLLEYLNLYYQCKLKISVTNGFSGAFADEERSQDYNNNEKLKYKAVKHISAMAVQFYELKIGLKSGVIEV